jgi:hypothetical protein
MATKLFAEKTYNKRRSGYAYLQGILPYGVNWGNVNV